MKLNMKKIKEHCPICKSIIIAPQINEKECFIMCSNVNCKFPFREKDNLIIVPKMSVSEAMRKRISGSDLENGRSLKNTDSKKEFIFPSDTPNPYDVLKELNLFFEGDLVTEPVPDVALTDIIKELESSLGTFEDNSRNQT